MRSNVFLLLMTFCANKLQHLIIVCNESNPTLNVCPLVQVSRPLITVLFPSHLKLFAKADLAMLASTNTIMMPHNSAFLVSERLS